MAYGFSFWTGTGTLIQNVSTDAFLGAVVARQIVPHKVSTVINFSGTDFSNYYVTYWYRGGGKVYDDIDPTPRFVDNPGIFLPAPTVNLNTTNKTATVYWDVLVNQLNPYNAVYIANLEVIVIGV
jgi:hypothetical protein